MVILTYITFLIAALLYASVGHGGASSYLALMVWLDWPIDMVRPQALILNVVVSLSGTVLFFRAGAFRRKLFVPLITASIPLAWIGGNMRLPSELYEGLLAVGLIVGAWRLLYQPPQKKIVEAHQGMLLVIGGLIGWVSGMIGIGGGIFLTPVLIVAGWATPKEAAALSAPFILVNSIAGLLGVTRMSEVWHGLHWWLIPVVALGGLIGAWWGSRRASSRQLRYALSLVLAVASAKLVIS